ncbi:hypothetical protein [Fibrobacter sp. UWB12]|jgi:hypothetical protein|uniref:hypothetical protein n=1 Tax=Fibrobacter sp. UWB12 TaxID=1896203 RepID=UPI000922C2D9|nr:hypothetical protein [Fibrobacter sp. UWB12]SHL01610.1 hypothetical protein SAMN05720759_11316 [Fibrobacter sp. UWB12]
MKNSFQCYIDSAAAQKKLFDESIDSVKDSLVEVVAESTALSEKNPQIFKESEPVYSTGWLKGSLSYPWAIIVGIIIPSFFGNKF